MKPVLHIEQLRFDWNKDVPCLDIETLQIDAGESVFLHGPSGCGKSTLLSLMAGVLTAQHGHIRLLEQDWASMSTASRDRHRVDHVGYIFQQFNLLPYLDVIDNVLLPCRFSSRRRQAAEKDASLHDAAAHWLRGMGLSETLWRRPARELSVGQQQRVAAARALIGSPALIIADEPTSALDEDRRDSFLDLLQSACASTQGALILVSHDRRIASRFARSVFLPQINRAAMESAD